MVTTEELFKALADGTRQRLLKVLSLRDLSVTELVEVLDQPQSTISRHLRVLHKAGLLIDRRHGTTMMYAAKPPSPVHGRASNGNGTANGGQASVPLRDRLLGWVQQEPLEEGLRGRLERVIDRRPAGTTQFFDSVGARWDQLRIEAFGEVFHFEALAALLPASWTVADVGTGTGYLLPVLARHFHKVIAIEPATSMLEIAKHRPGVRPGQDVEYRLGSLADLPLADGEVDLAIASLVLHHVAEPAEALRALRRGLAPGGRVMLIEQDVHDNVAFHDRMGDYHQGLAPARLGRWLRSAGFVEVATRCLTTARPTARNLGPVPGLFVLTASATDEAQAANP